MRTLGISNRWPANSRSRSPSKKNTKSSSATPMQGSTWRIRNTGNSSKPWRNWTTAKNKVPAAFSTNKSFKKKIQEERKHLHQNDPKFKETLFTTYRSKRAAEQYLHQQNPGIQKLPKSQQKAGLERARRKNQNDPSYLKLLATADKAQQALEKAYPQLFVSDQSLNQKRKAAQKALKDNPDFQALQKRRAKAYFATQDYLHQSNPRLVELRGILEKQ